MNEAIQEVDPQLALAVQQEQQAADVATMSHLRQRVPLLRAQLNLALLRVQELEAELAKVSAPKKAVKRTAPLKSATTRKRAAGS